MTEIVEVVQPQISSSIGKWKAYSAYKDSYVEWLGEIPTHWELRRLGHVSSVIDPQPDHRAPAFAQGDGFPYVGIRDLNPDGTVNTETARKIEEEAVKKQETSFRIENGDIVFCKVGTLGYPRHIKPDGRLALSATLVLIKCNSLATTFYLRYVLDSKAIYTQIDLLATGSTRAALGIEQIRKFNLLIPPLPEQRAIAAFLDHETSKINTLKAKKERLIELLQEKRAALISHAVTKGLDPDAKMKDSGVEWLGEIPAHWEVLPLKRFVKIRYGLGQPPAQLDDGLPFIRATNVKSGKIMDEGMLYVDSTEIPQGRDALLKTEEIIVVRSGAYTGDSAIVPNKYEGAVAGYDMVVTITKGFSKFIAWQLLSREVRGLQFSFYSLRAAQSHLNVEDLGTIMFVVPSTTEQHTIAAYLDQETTKIDALISKVGEAIEKLKEYSSALISAAVTGKIDVRDEVEFAEEINSRD